MSEHPDFDRHVAALVEAFRADDVDAMTAALLALPKPAGARILREALAVRKAEDAAAVPRDDAQ